MNLGDARQTLAAGVPAVVVPLAYEQGAIAARVRRAGAARVCTARLFRRRQLTAAIRDVCETDSYARAARKIQGDIGAAGGVTRAADIVEEVLRTGKPVLNAAAEARRSA